MIDKNIFDLVLFCKKFGGDWTSLHYSYVLEKFELCELCETCEAFEQTNLTVFDLLHKPTQFINDLTYISERTVKRRKLKPIQFAKEKQENLDTRLEKHLEMLKTATTEKDADRVKELKLEISEIKKLIAAHKDEMALIKLDKK